MGLMFVGVACQQRLVPKKNLCVYDIAFVYMSAHPHTKQNVESWTCQSLKHYTFVFFYGKTRSLKSVNEVLSELFCQKNMTMENIPPTQDALLQHSKCVACQDGILTKSSLMQHQTKHPHKKDTVANSTEKASLQFQCGVHYNRPL